MHAPWSVRVVIVATYEPAPGSGGVGELGLWCAREGLSETMELAGWEQPLRVNRARTIVGLVSGTGASNAAAALMALGLDPRFDLSRAYFLIAGVAGVDPAMGQIGSVAWARFVVNDVAREIDVREAPDGWPYGIFPVGSRVPQPERVPVVGWARSNLFALPAGLAQWAFAQTRDVALADGARVIEGDVMASNRVWHGERLTQFARDWVALQSGGKGRFAMASMEDAGFMTAVERLAAAGRIDARRVMLLRASSNYTMPLAGMSAVDSATAPMLGMGLAVESAWRAGSPIVQWIVEHWDEARETVPGGDR